MSQHSTRITSSNHLSLSVYISILLVLVAVIPLLVTLGSVAIFLRPALIFQISSDMERDAQTHVQLLDTYLAERLNDIKTLSESTPVHNLFAGDQNSKNLASDQLATTLHRDVANYISLSLLDPQGNVVLSYPNAPRIHGKYIIQPGVLQQLQQSEQVVLSDVFFDTVANNPSVDLYARVLNNNFQVVGIVRASLGLHRIWQPVDSEPQTSGADSYAFVLDQHGVRIAYTNPDHSGFKHPPYLFKAVAPLPADFQQRIKDENLYGNSSIPVTEIADPILSDMQAKAQTSAIFQFQPIGQNQVFEAASYTSTVVPWTYYLLKPLSTVTGLADQQLVSVLLIVAFVLVLAIVVGLRVGRRITFPIMRSVTSLRKNSVSLKTLAEQEQVIATEQSWMVEASEVALKSIKYYTHAANMATQHLSAVGMELTRNSGNVNASHVNKAVKEMLDASVYIEQAIKHQEVANEKLAAVLQITTQAAEQLNNGARSTDDAATQLEQIVYQLTSVVGETDVRDGRPFGD